MLGSQLHRDKKEDLKKPEMTAANNETKNELSNTATNPDSEPATSREM